MTAQLNRYRDEYYNSNAPSVSDEVYDRMYDELAALEKETGIWMADSSTHTVGFQAVSALKKTNHPISLFLLDKTKSVEEDLVVERKDHAAETGMVFFLLVWQAGKKRIMW